MTDDPRPLTLTPEALNALLALAYGAGLLAAHGQRMTASCLETQALLDAARRRWHAAKGRDDDEDEGAGRAVGA